MHYFAHEYEQAEGYCRTALEISNDFVFARRYLFDIYSKAGRNDEAFKEYLEWDKFFESDSKSKEGSVQAPLKAAYSHSGLKGLLRERISYDVRTRLQGYSYDAALCSALLSDKEQGLTWLEKACENRDFLLPFANVDPIFDDLRAEPRFKAVLRCVRLE